MQIDDEPTVGMQMRRTKIFPFFWIGIFSISITLVIFGIYMASHPISYEEPNIEEPNIEEPKNEGKEASEYSISDDFYELFSQIHNSCRDLFILWIIFMCIIQINAIFVFIYEKCNNKVEYTIRYDDVDPKIMIRINLALGIYCFLSMVFSLHCFFWEIKFYGHQWSHIWLSLLLIALIIVQFIGLYLYAIIINWMIKKCGN
jgi:hypothetical protein